jgi:hypothetical protein
LWELFGGIKGKGWKHTGWDSSGTIFSFKVVVVFMKPPPL